MKNILLFFGALFLMQTALFAQDTLPAPSTYQVNKVSFNMVRVEMGGFWMGAQHMDTAEFNYDRMSQIDEVPVHYVAMNEDYYIGQTEVTQKLWKAVMGYNPSRYKCPKRPVTNVNYYEVQEFLRRVDSITGMKFRLPMQLGAAKTREAISTAAATRWIVWLGTMATPTRPKRLRNAAPTSWVSTI